MILYVKNQITFTKWDWKINSVFEGDGSIVNPLSGLIVVQADPVGFRQSTKGQFQSLNWVDRRLSIEQSCKNIKLY